MDAVVDHVRKPRDDVLSNDVLSNGVDSSSEDMSVEDLPSQPAAPPPSPVNRPKIKRNIAAIGIVAVAAGAYWTGLVDWPFGSAKPLADASTTEIRGKEPAGSFRPTSAQWQTLTVEPVKAQSFRTTLTTDGKIAIDEDVATPVFSPYVGRVMKLHAKPGDIVEIGSPLFVVEASDMVQGQNDFLAAKANVNKANANLAQSEINLKRQRQLILSNAVARRDLEQAEATQIAAVNDLKANEVALEAARNRLRILGKTDVEITAFETGKQRISAATTVLAPLSGTIVQRKVGPGQLINGASTDPVFVIGDLSTVWFIANVRETDASKIKIGQDVEFTILALPDRVFKSKISYIAASVNPDTHRLQVRGTIANPEGYLRPEMFANMTIVTSVSAAPSPSVPRHAVIYEGDVARVWVARSDQSIELRKIQPGIVSGNSMQVMSGLQEGDRVVTRGSLFIDRLADPKLREAD